MTNNIVSVSNSNITGLYYQKQNNKKTFIDINSKNRSKIIEHFNLQKFRAIREFNFYSLNEEENINYHYQAKSLMNGIKKNLNQAHDATDNFIDNLQKNNVVINKNIILDITSFIQINKDLEEGIKSRNKLKKMNSQIKKLQDQINQNENDSEIEM